MNAFVIDTNVLLVANGRHAGISAECQQQCIERLLQIQRRGVVVIDDAYRVLREYRLKTSPNQPKGPGDVFLKWVLQNQANLKRIHQVTLSEISPDIFVEFPDPILQAQFDASDRKFAAIANAHTDKPPVLQAADCKWLRWWKKLGVHGGVGDFLCPADAKACYTVKYPVGPEPEVP